MKRSFTFPSSLFSLQWRAAAMFAAFWTFSVIMALVWNLLDHRLGVLEMARDHARGVFERDVVYRRWSANHGGVYVPVTEETQPNPYLEVDERDITTPSGRVLTLVNPAYMTRQVHELGAKEFGVHSHITSLTPIRPENAADPWETRALESFENGKTEVSSIEVLEGETVMRLMRPLQTEEQCLKCHVAQGYKVGDIRGGISVAVSMDGQWPISWYHLIAKIMGHGLLWILGLGGIGLSFNRLRSSTLARNRTEKTLASHRQQQVVILKLGQSALSGLDLSEFFDETVAAVADTLQVEYCKVLKLLPGAEAVFLSAGVGWKEGLVGQATVPLGRDSQAGYTLQSREPVIVEDLETETRFSGPALLRDHNVVSGMSVIIGTIETPWGVLGAHTSKRRDFSRDDINFLQAVANVLADAIARNQAEEELTKHHENLEKLVEERTRELAEEITAREQAQEKAERYADEMRSVVKSMSGRENRMAELKRVVKKLRAQIEEAGMTPAAGDPLMEKGREKDEEGYL